MDSFFCVGEICFMWEQDLAETASALWLLQKAQDTAKSGSPTGQPRALS